MFVFACFQSILNIYIKKPNIFPGTRVGRVFKKDMQKRKADCSTTLYLSDINPLIPLF